MHELGILHQIVKKVNGIALENQISKIKHIALEVGENSGFVPQYLTKLFPVAIDRYPVLKKAKLLIAMVPGKGLVIKEIGY